MTKTELKKQLAKTALELLENEFGVEFDGTDEGGRLGFTIAGFNGQFSRGDMSVTLWESIPLSGHGWTPAEILLHLVQFLFWQSVHLLVEPAAGDGILICEIHNCRLYCL